VKRKSAEPSAEVLPDAKPSKTQEGGAGKINMPVILTYLVLAIILILVIIFATKINNNTFRINL
jgi:DNA/RNA endonuclease YhcR with UshA esterase domain